MKKIAIDVVLLPSEHMINDAIAINQQIRQEEGRRIVLNKENCFPHISLLMGCIEEAHLPKVSKLLDSIGSFFTFFHLQIEAAQTDTMPDGKPVTVLNISKDPLLQSLHQKAIEVLLPFLSFDASLDMLYGNPSEIKEISLYFINNFLKNSSFDKFSPHITIGLGTYPADEYKTPFTASTLALCQLGNYCTCRRILHTVSLREQKPI
jgi:2'-5' RNA ligase